VALGSPPGFLLDDHLLVEAAVEARDLCAMGRRSDDPRLGHRRGGHLRNRPFRNYGYSHGAW
jgi:hypothetical protein